jgi:hypothetical protein
LIRPRAANRAEKLVLLEADGVVSLGSKLSDSVRRGHGHRQHELCGLAAACAQRRTNRRASCDAVIDDDGGASRNIDALTIAEIARATPLDFGKLAVAHGLELGLAHVGERDDVF